MRMSVQIQMEIDDPDQAVRLGEALNLLAAMNGVKDHASGGEGGGSSALDYGGNLSGWTFRAFEELWDEISRGAKTVLRAMASQPEGLSEEELLGQLEGLLTDGELDMMTVGGYLSSVALRRSRFANHVPVYWKDPASGLFTMPPDVAGYIQTLATADERRESPPARFSKSEEMRRLAREGLSTAEIAKRLGVRYQFVHNVLSQAKLLKQGDNRES